MPGHHRGVGNILGRARSVSGRPPYDIVKTRDEQEAPAEDYLHRGIAAPPFEHRFELPDDVRATERT